MAVTAAAPIGIFNSGADMGADIAPPAVPWQASWLVLLSYRQTWAFTIG